MKSVWLLCFLSFTACKTTYNLSENYASFPNVMKVWATTIENKKKKYTIDFSLRNESQKDVVVNLTDLKCYKGSALGEFTHPLKFMHHSLGEQHINLKAGETKSFQLLCDFRRPMGPGDYIIVVERIYENPNGDGKTLGKVLGKDLTWKAVAQ